MGCVGEEGGGASGPDAWSGDAGDVCGGVGSRLLGYSLIRPTLLGRSHHSLVAWAQLYCWGL